MLVGMVRWTETQTFTVTGQSLAEMDAAAAAVIPDGFVAVDVKRQRVKGEAATMPELEAKVPDGWQIVSVRVA